MLEPIARGVTGDDEGNRQLAEYMLAKALFREHGFADFEDQLSSDYPERDFVVQYRESDFSFVSRLLEKAVKRGKAA